MKKEFLELVEKGWLNNEEAEFYSNDEKILSAMEKSTSPVKENVFNALKLTPFNEIRVVILGKDPYPNPKDAHGLAFSSKNNVTPDSLKNIFKAIDKTYSTNLFEKAQNDLTNWAKQGVLLLNTGLTYQKIKDETLDKAQITQAQNKVQKENMKIWKPFVKTVIKKVLTIKERPVVMMLWGNDAHNIVFENIKDKEFKTKLHLNEPVTVPDTSILLLQCAHPSPLSVNRGGNFPSLAPLYFKECEKHLGDLKINWADL